MIPAAIAAVGAISNQLIQKSNQPKQQEQPDSLGINSVMNGNQNPNEMATPSEVEGTQSKDLMQGMAKDAFQTGFNAVMSKGVQSAMSPSASELGKQNKQYMEAAYPNLNEWERAGAAATTAGIQSGQQDNQKQMLQMQLNNQKDIARINADTTLKTAGIQSMTSRQNTKDQVYAQNEMLDLNKQKLQGEVKQIAANTNLTNEQASTAIVDRLVKRAQQMNINIDSRQKVMLTKKISQEIEFARKGGQTSVGKAVQDVFNLSKEGQKQLDITIDNLWNTVVSDFKEGTADFLKKSEGIYQSVLN